MKKVNENNVKWRKSKTYFISSSAYGTVINYGSGSDFLTSQKVTVPTVPVPQRWFKLMSNYFKNHTGSGVGSGYGSEKNHSGSTTLVNSQVNPDPNLVHYRQMNQCSSLSIQYFTWYKKSWLFNSLAEGNVPVNSEIVPGCRSHIYVAKGVTRQTGKKGQKNLKNWLVFNSVLDPD